MALDFDERIERAWRSRERLWAFGTAVLFGAFIGGVLLTLWILLR